ncbi:ribbon-helix-helix protein, CopG family [Chelativorans intermedius]|uniref:Ribbon-helix-helix protein, CopG family n=1 Tax=Chelativorans intermedius TaxID=515947 RepID=A0ABV6DBA4_9HYPH|nr:ribbon-helix-helix protein, CopG family [Chelativorans intermedius]MCT9000225.1 ribbon-helix-helix protein, CopG family [Chelativorans intermedius]
MARPKGNRETARLSVSLDAGDYAILAEIARKEDVSVAWVVRRAVSEVIRSHTSQATKPELPLAPKVSSVSKAGSS